MLKVATIQGQRMLIGFELPTHVKKGISQKLNFYAKEYDFVPHDRWHLTMLFLGEVEKPQELAENIGQNLSQTFVPTVRFSHIGSGLAPGQLWVWGQEALVLDNIRNLLRERVEKSGIAVSGLENNSLPMVPHVKVGRRKKEGRKLTADSGLRISFNPREAVLFSSDRGPQVNYTRFSNIELN